MNIKIILEALANTIQVKEGVVIDIENIAILNDGDEFFESKSPMVLSIVNIVEDRTLSNQSVYVNKKPDFNERHEHPTKHLIVSLLFSAYSNKPEKYLDGLDKLNKVIVFFQKNTSLYFKLTPPELITYRAYLEKPNKPDYTKIVYETVSLSIEQLNQMWSYLGSKYMPSILVKMRLIEVQNPLESPGDRTVNSVKINLWENNEADPIGFLETISIDTP